MVSQLLFSNYVWQEVDLEMDIISIYIPTITSNFINNPFIELKILIKTIYMVGLQLVFAILSAIFLESLSSLWLTFSSFVI